MTSKRAWASLSIAVSLCAGSWLAYAVPDVVRIRRVNPDAPAQLPEAKFSHRRHSQYQCYACHPTLFPQAPAGFTHADMEAGRACGACHDGKTAAAPKEQACEVCHGR